MDKLSYLWNIFARDQAFYVQLFIHKLFVSARFPAVIMTTRTREAIFHQEKKSWLLNRGARLSFLFLKLPLSSSSWFTAAAEVQDCHCSLACRPAHADSSRQEAGMTRENAIFTPEYLSGAVGSM